MSVKIRFKGFELEVAAHEVGVVIRQLEALERQDAVLTAAEPSPAPVQELPVARASRFIWPMPSGAKQAGQAELIGPEMDSERAEALSNFEVQRLTLRLLEMLADLDPFRGGAGVEEVARVLDVKHPKGIGSRAALINKVIVGYGYDVEDAYRNPRDASGARKWMPGPAIRDVIDAIRKGLGLPKRRI